MQDSDETLDFASRLFIALPEMTDYLRSILKRAEGKNEPVQRTARGLLDRFACWLVTMGRLNLTDDFQAHLAGLRAAIELTIDLALLCGDPKLNEMLEAWELSAKYKHATSVAGYVAQHPNVNFGSTPGLAAAFVKEHRERVQALRRHYWPSRKGDHPMRWTGRNLRDDAHQVQKRYPGTRIELLYAETYAFACWQVHGSALVLTRNATASTVLPHIGVALSHMPGLALACAEFTLRILGLFTPADQQTLVDAHEKWLFRWAGHDWPG